MRSTDPYLNEDTRQFLSQIMPAIGYGWAVLEEEPIDYEYNLEKFGLSKVAIDKSLQVCLDPKMIQTLGGLAQYAGLFYKSKRCLEGQKLDWLLKAKAQAEQIATSIDPEFTSSIFLWDIGYSLYGVECHEEAIISYDQAIAIDSNSSRAWVGRGVSLSALGRKEEAIASYDQALAIKPDKHEACNNRGNSLSALGREEEAIASYDQAVAIKPDKHEAWNNRGVSLSALERKEEAIASYDQALALQPNNLNALLAKGYVLLTLEHWTEGISLFDQLLEKQSDSFLAWSLRGAALASLGRDEEAIASYDQALIINPDDAMAYYGKACYYGLHNQVDLAIDCLQQAIALDSQWKENAKTETDFDLIRESDRFRALVGEGDTL